MIYIYNILHALNIVIFIRWLYIYICSRNITRSCKNITMLGKPGRFRRPNLPTPILRSMPSSQVPLPQKDQLVPNRCPTGFNSSPQNRNILWFGHICHIYVIYVKNDTHSKSKTQCLKCLGFLSSPRPFLLVVAPGSL
jgi:hypothetical protein